MKANEGGGGWIYHTTNTDDHLTDDHQVQKYCKDQWKENKTKIREIVMGTETWNLTEKWRDNKRILKQYKSDDKHCDIKEMRRKANDFSRNHAWKYNIYKKKKDSRQFKWMVKLDLLYNGLAFLKSIVVLIIHKAK